MSSTTTPLACQRCGRADYPHVCEPALGAFPVVATGETQCRVTFRVVLEGLDGRGQPIPQAGAEQ